MCNGRFSFCLKMCLHIKDSFFLNLVPLYIQPCLKSQSHLSDRYRYFGREFNIRVG